jgi:hypothetical protein
MALITAAVLNGSQTEVRRQFGAGYAAMQPQTCAMGSATMSSMT